MEQPKWEWMDSILGAILGVFSGIGGMTAWTSKKFKDVDDRHQKLREDIGRQINHVHARVTEHAEEIATLTAQHDAKMQRLAGMEESIRRVDEKQDKQMRILLALASEKKVRITE